MLLRRCRHHHRIRFKRQPTTYPVLQSKAAHLSLGPGKSQEPLTIIIWCGSLIVYGQNYGCSKSKIAYGWIMGGQAAVAVAVVGIYGPPLTLSASSTAIHHCSSSDRHFCEHVTFSLCSAFRPRPLACIPASSPRYARGCWDQLSRLCAFLKSHQHQNQCICTYYTDHH